MRKITLLVIALCTAFFLLRQSSSEPDHSELFSFAQSSESLAEQKALGLEKIPGAMYAMDLWNAQRAYPNDELPAQGYYQAWEQSKNDHAFEQRRGDAEPWESMGPHNTAGRMLCVAFNPQNPNTVWAGSASGGIWRSYTEGYGAAAWERVSTGFPELGVMSIAFHPTDSNIIYAGTGEVYNYANAGAGAADRAKRGSYGIGILKSTDGGLTWSKSLDWTYDQRRGVAMIRTEQADPDRVWAATTEGVYLSTDAGGSWTKMLNELNATDVFPHYTNPNILIAACGNFAQGGHGIYRSTDAGANWTKVVSPGIPTNYNGKGLIGSSPENPDVFYISIGDGFFGPAATWLCKTGDAGATWVTVNNTDYALWQGWFAHDVAPHPDNAQEVVCIGISVWKSTNGGFTLLEEANSSLTLGTPPIDGPDGDANYIHSDNHDVVWHPTDPDVLYIASDGGIFRSDDRGLTFRSMNGGLQTTQFYNGTATSYLDSLFFMGGLQDNSTVIWTGTKAWSRNFGGDGSYAATHPNVEEVLYLSYQFLNLARSNNSGTTWNTIDIPETGGEQTVFIAPYRRCEADPNIMFGGREYVYRSDDGGLGWYFTTSLPLDGNPVLALEISRSNCDIIYATTAPTDSRSGVFLSMDGGVSFSNITGSLPDRYMTDIAINPVDPAIAYITLSGFGSSHLYKTTDYGASWVDVGADLPDVPGQAVCIDPSNPDHVYFGNDFGVWYSPDGGALWESWSEGLYEAQMIFDLRVNRVNRKIVAATHGNGAWMRDLEGAEPVVGIEDPLLSQQIKLYPNPTQDQLFVEWNGTGSLERVQILDLSGKLWMDERIQLGSMSSLSLGADLRDLAPGQYLIQLQHEDQSWQKQMLIKTE